MSSFSDRLADAVGRKGPLCVGLDPRWDSLPKTYQGRYPSRPPTERAMYVVRDFGFRVLELVEPFTGVVKPQAAFFEQFGPAGMIAMAQLLGRARAMGFVTILDAKRG